MKYYFDNKIIFVKILFEIRKHNIIFLLNFNLAPNTTYQIFKEFTGKKKLSKYFCKYMHPSLRNSIKFPGNGWTLTKKILFAGSLHPPTSALTS